MCTSWVSLMTHFVAGQADLSTCTQATCIQVTVFIGAGLYPYIRIDKQAGPKISIFFYHCPRVTQGAVALAGNAEKFALLPVQWHGNTFVTFQRFHNNHAGSPRGLEEPRQIQKLEPHKMNCVRGVWGHAPGNFEILHALKCVLGAPEALFHTCTQNIYTCMQVAVLD